jgi:hypothetical protein
LSQKDVSQSFHDIHDERAPLVKKLEDLTSVLKKGKNVFS